MDGAFEVQRRGSIAGKLPDAVAARIWKEVVAGQPQAPAMVQ